MLYEMLPSPTSTRLINLLPGAPEDPLECELFVIDLESDHVQYPAISYIWGDPSDKKPIQCMGEILMIPKSLHSFLKVRRNSEKPCICWADAICINQSGNKEALRERAHQIGMMGTIFSNAKLVLVYLGEEPMGFKEFMSVPSTLLNLLADEIDPQLWSLDALKVPAYKAINSLILDTFDEIMSRPWYQRVWTLQEFMLAQDLEICIGRWVIEYPLWQATCHMFDSFYNYLDLRRLQERRIHKDDDLFKSCRRSRIIFDHCRFTYKQEASIPLTTFVEVSLYLNTTDVCDRLYGGYGILGRSVLQSVPVDYGISINILSHRLSALLLAEEELTFVLQHCSGLNDHMPTWCIGLDRSQIDRNKSAYTSTIALSRDHGLYSAAGNSTQSSSVIVAESGIMAVSGCILETIKSLTPPLPPMRFDDARSLLKFLATADWIESTLLWLGQLRGLPIGTHSWDKLPTQTLWRSVTNELWRTLIQYMVAAIEESGTRPENGPEARGNRRIIRPEPEFFKVFVTWLHFLHMLQQNHCSGRNMNILASEDHDTFLMYAANIYLSVGKRVGAMFSKRLALLPNEAKIGDEICIFEGVKAPFVLRKSGEHHKIVGSCYLHGMMDGEALKRDDWKPTKLLIE